MSEHLIKHHVFLDAGVTPLVEHLVDDDAPVSVMVDGTSRLVLRFESDLELARWAKGLLADYVRMHQHDTPAREAVDDDPRTIGGQRLVYGTG